MKYLPIFRHKESLDGMTMRTMNKISKICVLLLLSAALMLCTSCGSEKAYPKSTAELDGLRAGILMGSVEENGIKNAFPNSELHYYNNRSDLPVALVSDKIDFFYTDSLICPSICASNEGLTYLDEPMIVQGFGAVFNKEDPKSQLIKNQFNEFIAKCKEDGTLAALEDKWIKDGLVLEDPPSTDIPASGDNGIITMTTSSMLPPFDFIANGELTGFEVEFAALFCKEYGYGLKIEDTNFSSIIAAVTSGKSDFGMGSFTISEERAQSVDFSDEYIANKSVPVVRTREESGISFVEKIKNSFRKTFILEERWKLVLDGLRVTLEISFFSMLFGTLAGFAVFLLGRTTGKTVNKAFEFFSWVFSGTPMVVVLMILYYVIFGKTSLSGSFVASVAFGTSIALSVFSILRTSVLSIDPGQIEGSLSLGFSEIQTLFNIVLPQAMVQFIPNYLNSIVDMVKGTAVVGYIAVQDLTKVSDIIRSRTYEAFFSLIAIAFVYILIVFILTMLLKKIGKKFEPKLRTEKQILERFGR